MPLSKLVLYIPGPDEPGYGRRMMYVAAYEEAARSRQMNAASVGGLFGLLADFVAVDDETRARMDAAKSDAERDAILKAFRAEAKEILMDLSQNRLEAILTEVKGLPAGGGPAIPPSNPAS